MNHRIMHVLRRLDNQQLTAESAYDKLEDIIRREVKVEVATWKCDSCGRGCYSSYNSAEKKTIVSPSCGAIIPNKYYGGSINDGQENRSESPSMEQSQTDKA